MLKTPVAIIIFRRPDLTKRVLEAVARVKPEKLFVIADGPRADHPDDADACAATRAVIDSVDWDCEIVKDFAEENMGCGLRPGTGVSRVFEQVEEAIILEDDCVAHPSFFRYCEELLERYRDDERVMHIAGTNYRREDIAIPTSYYFSSHNNCWGWASWRRAFRHFDAGVKLWPELRETSWLKDVLENDLAVQKWARDYDVAYEKKGNVSYWDFQWSFACWANSGLSVVPRSNMILNAGCGEGATHTLNKNDPLGNLPARETAFPLEHPPTVLHNRDEDRKFFEEVILTRLNKRARKKKGLRRVAARLTPGFLKQAYRRQTPAPTSL